MSAKDSASGLQLPQPGAPHSGADLAQAAAPPPAQSQDVSLGSRDTLQHSEDSPACDFGGNVGSAVGRCQPSASEGAYGTAEGAGQPHSATRMDWNGLRKRVATLKDSGASDFRRVLNDTRAVCERLGSDSPEELMMMTMCLLDGTECVLLDLLPEEVQVLLRETAERIGTSLFALKDRESMVLRLLDTAGKHEIALCGISQGGYYHKELAASLLSRPILERVLALMGSSRDSTAAWAAVCIANLARALDFDDRCNIFIDMGFVPALAALLRGRSHRCTVWALVSICAVSHMVGRGPSEIVSAGAVPELVRLLESERLGEARNVVVTLAQLAEASKEFKSMIVQAGAVPLLVHLLPLDEEALARNVAAAIMRLCVGDIGAKRVLLEAGGIPWIAQMLSSTKRLEAFEAAQIFSTIANGFTEGKQAIIDAGAVPSLVQMLASSEENLAYLAATTLGRLAWQHPAGQMEVLTTPGALTGLAKLVESAPKNEASKACLALKNVAFSLPLGQAAVADAGGIHAILHRLGAEGYPTIDQRIALQALTHLLIQCKAAREAAQNANQMTALVRLLLPDNNKIGELAASVIGHAVHMHKPCQLQAVAAGAVPALVRLLGSSDRFEGKMAATCLGQIACDCGPGRDALLEAGALGRLVPMLASLPDGYACSAAVALGHVAHENPAGREAVQEAGAVPDLVRMLQEGVGEDLRWAAFAVTEIAYMFKRGREALHEAGAVPAVLVLLAAPWRQQVPLMESMRCLAALLADSDVERLLGSAGIAAVREVAGMDGAPGLSKKANQILRRLGK